MFWCYLQRHVIYIKNCQERTLAKCNVNILSTLFDFEGPCWISKFHAPSKRYSPLWNTLDTKDKLYHFDTKLQYGHFLPGIALSSSVEPSETEGRRGEWAPIFLLRGNNSYQLLPVHCIALKRAQIWPIKKEFPPKLRFVRFFSLLRGQLHAYDRSLF